MADVDQTNKLTKITPLPEHWGGRHLSLMFIIMVSLMGFWVIIRLAFSQTSFSQPEHLWCIAVAFVLFGVMVGLLGLVGSIIKPSGWTGLILLLGCAVALALFPLSYVTGAAAAVAVLALVRYWAMVHDEATARIRFNLIRNITHGLATTVTLLALSISLLFLGHNIAQPEFSQKITGRVSRAASQVVVNLMGSSLKGFRPEMTVDEFLLQYSPKDLTSAVPTEFLPEGVPASLLEEQERLMAQTLDVAAREAFLNQARQELFRPFGVSVNSQTTMGQAVSDIIDQRFKPILEQVEPYVPPAIALSLFATLSIIGGVLFWWVAVWATIWYGLFRIMHWVDYQVEPADIVRVSLKP